MSRVIYRQCVYTLKRFKFEMVYVLYARDNRDKEMSVSNHLTRVNNGTIDFSTREDGSTVIHAEAKQDETAAITSGLSN